MSQINIENIDCINSDSLKKLTLSELKKISHIYGLSSSGNKMTLCKNIQHYINIITIGAKGVYTPKNKNQIKSIDDLINILDIEDLNDLHTLSETDIDFLFDRLNKEEPQLKLDKQLQANPDLKIKLLVDTLANKFCECIHNLNQQNLLKYKTKTIIPQCQRAIFKNNKLKISKFICDPTPTLLPKYGSRVVLTSQP